MSKIPILFELMKKNKITQQQLSEAVKVSQGNISDWKKGRSSPGIEVLPKIAEYFNVSVDYLLGYNPKPQKDEKSEKLLALAAVLTESQIDSLIEMSKKFLET